MKNFGTPLSREEQRNIRGGFVPHCVADQYVNCNGTCLSTDDYCNDVGCATGGSTPEAICAYYGSTASNIQCWNEANCEA